MKRSMTTSLALLAVTIWVPAAGLTQDRVSALSDLVGSSARSGDAELEERGYEYARGSKSGDSSYSFWKEPKSGRCVSVRTTDGRYAAIVYTPDSDCETEESKKDRASSKKDGTFETVCGVEAAGKAHRYVCHARTEGCQGEGFCRTILSFPDNELRVTWHKGDKIEVESPGVQAEKTTSSFRDGLARFDFGGNTYFFYREPKRAEKEVARFRP